MGLFDWMTSSAGRDLDRRVGGTEGTAQAAFLPLADDATVVARASIANGHRGTAAVRSGERRDEGRDSVVSQLGPGKDLRGREVVVEATIERAGSGDLAVLAVELSQADPSGSGRPPLAFETFSVESRFDEAGGARLSLVVRCG